VHTLRKCYHLQMCVQSSYFAEKKQNLKGSEIKTGNDFNLCVKYFLINHIWRQNTEALSPAYTENTKSISCSCDYSMTNNAWDINAVA